MFFVYLNFNLFIFFITLHKARRNQQVTHEKIYFASLDCFQYSIQTILGGLWQQKFTFTTMNENNELELCLSFFNSLLEPKFDISTLPLFCILYYIIRIFYLMRPNETSDVHWIHSLRVLRNGSCQKQTM